MCSNQVTTTPRKLMLTITQEENGYVIHEGDLNGPSRIEKRHVATDAADLRRVVGNLALATEIQPNTAADEKAAKKK